MPELPKIKLKKPYGHPSEEVHDFEGAKNLIFGEEDKIAVVDGRVIKSYDELVQLAHQDSYKDKEFMEVWSLNVEIGGG